MGIENPAGAKKNLEKIKARKDILVNGSREGIKKSIADNDNITLLEVKRILSILILRLTIKTLHDTSL
jgi:DNA invertase Pin-like site-specific DNA recombinase